jgi:hypothetical protein
MMLASRAFLFLDKLGARLTCAAPALSLSKGAGAHDAVLRPTQHWVVHANLAQTPSKGVPRVRCRGSASSPLGSCAEL